MKLRTPIAFVLLLAVLFVPSACGKKAPPFLPVGELSLKVDQLSAEWRDGAFCLQGNIVGPKEQIDDPSVVTGCRIIYACYPLDNAPCEDCPIDYRELKEMEGTVILQGRFYCEVSEKKAEGIYFFKVSLTGKKGATGPYSSRAKLVITP